MPAAKGRGRTRSWLTKNQHELHNEDIIRPLRRRRMNILHRVQSRKASNVDDILYGFLGDLAAVSNKRRHTKMKHFKVPNVRIKRSGRAGKKTRKAQAKKRISTFSLKPVESTSKSIFETTDDNFSLSTSMESATTRPSSVYSNASTLCSEPPVAVDTKQGVKDLLKRNSLIEILKNYIKVGIEADEKRAKSYMKKAISFGVNSGFLKPVENSTHLLEISPELPGIKVNFKKASVADRKRRKNMRRGTENFTEFIRPKKKRNSSKQRLERRQKEVKTSSSRKRTRSVTRNTNSTLKGDSKKNERKQPKKRAKISKEPKKTQRDTKNYRNRRSPTPWKPVRPLPSEDQITDSLCEQKVDMNQAKNELNEESNIIKEKVEKRRMISSPVRKDEGKNHIEDGNIPGNKVQNFNLNPELLQPVESAQQQGDKA